MPNEANTGAGEAQGADPSQAQGAATQAQGAAAQPEAGAASSSGTADVAELQAKLAQFEKDNRAFREERRQREEVDRQAQEAKLSEAEKQARSLGRLETENADLRRQLQEERTRNRTTAAASKLGFRDPGDALKLLDHAAIEFDADGSPKNLEKLLSDLLKSKDYLAAAAPPRTGTPTLGPRGTADTGPDMNDLLRQAAGRT